MIRFGEVDLQFMEFCVIACALVYSSITAVRGIMKVLKVKGLVFYF